MGMALIPAVGGTLQGPVTVVGAETVTGTLTAQGDLVHTGGNVGFFGVGPVVRRAAWTLFGAAARVMAAIGAAQPAATASTNVAPFGYTTAAQADAVVACCRTIVTDVATLQGNVRQIVADMQAYGFES